MTIELKDQSLKVKGVQITNTSTTEKKLLVTDERSGVVTRIKLKHKDTFTPRTRPDFEDGYLVEDE